MIYVCDFNVYINGVVFSFLSLSLYVGSLVKSPAASASTQVREIISFLKGHLDLVKGIVHYIRTAAPIM